jgi:transcriptional regulator with XRE-family HTH domain
MKTFGEVIAEARAKAGLTQRELAARIRNEKGKAISAPYLNDMEHNLRHPPRGYLLEELAKHLDLDSDLLYFLAGRLPRDVVPEKASEQQVRAAYRAFRRELRGKGKRDERGKR